MPPYIEDVLKEVTRRTGFCATLIMGGPVPTHNGEISTVRYVHDHTHHHARITDFVD